MTVYHRRTILFGAALLVAAATRPPITNAAPVLQASDEYLSESPCSATRPAPTVQETPAPPPKPKDQNGDLEHSPCSAARPITVQT